MATLGIAEFSQPFSGNAESFNERDAQFNGDVVEFRYAEFYSADETASDSQTFSSAQYGFSMPFSSVEREYNAGVGSQEISHPLNRGFYQETDVIFQNSDDTGAGIDFESLATELSATDSAAATSSHTLEVAIGTGVDETGVNDPNENVNGDQGLVTDAATATEGQAFIALSSSDSVSATEAEVMQIEFYDFFEDEPVYVADEEALLVELTGSDSATAVETGMEVQTPDHFDNMVNEDDQQLAVTHAQEETLTYDEQESLLLVETEDFQYTEQQQVTVTKTADETATGVSAEAVTATLVSTDSSSVNEQHAVTATISDADVAVGSEAATVSAATSATDAGFSTETEVLGKFDSDPASVTDTAELYVEVSDSDTFAAAEAEFIPVLGASTGDGEPYFLQVLASNPRNYWRFAETSGQVVQDRQARADGLLYGTPNSVPGLLAGSNTAFKFDGQQRVEFGDLQIDWRHFSLEFVGRSLDGTVLQKTGELLVEASAGTTTFTIYNEQTPVSVSCDSVDGHFVLAVNNGVASLYCNGVLEESAEAFVFGNNTASALVVGQGGTGIVDEVALYRRPLIAEEVYRHYYAAILNEDYAIALQGFRPLLHVPLTGSLDEYDGGLEFTETGTVTYIDGPEKHFVEPDLAANFNGAVATYDTSTLLQALDTFSIGLTLRYDNATAAHRILSSGTDTWHVRLRSDGKLAFSNDGELNVLLSPSSVADGEWHTVSITADGSDAKLYVDGDEVATVAYAIELADDGTLKLGETYDGDLAHVFLGEHALTAAQVQLLHRTLSSGRADITPNAEVAGVLTDEPAKVFSLDGAIAQLQG